MHVLNIYSDISITFIWSVSSTATGRPSRRGATRRARDECVRTNLRQYGLEAQFVDVARADAGQLVRLLRAGAGSSAGASGGPESEGAVFDAIITDPPYGVPLLRIAYFIENSCAYLHLCCWISTLHFVYLCILH